MRLHIDRASGAVTINGKRHVVDLTELQPEIVQVNWNDDTGTVHYSDGTTTGLGDIVRFKNIIDLWNDKQIELRTRA